MSQVLADVTLRKWEQDPIPGGVAWHSPEVGTISEGTRTVVVMGGQRPHMLQRTLRSIREAALQINQPVRCSLHWLRAFIINTLFPTYASHIPSVPAYASVCLHMAFYWQLCNSGHGSSCMNK